MRGMPLVRIAQMVLWNRHRDDVDALLPKLRNLIGACVAANRPLRCLLIVDLACLFGERVTDILRVGEHVFDQLRNGIAEHRLLSVGCLRRGGGGRCGRGPAAAGIDVGCMQFLADVRAATHRAGQLGGIPLGLKRGAGCKPSLELMVPVATEVEYNHRCSPVRVVNSAVDDYISSTLAHRAWIAGWRTDVTALNPGRRCMMAKRLIRGGAA